MEIYGHGKLLLLIYINFCLAAGQSLGPFVTVGPFVMDVPLRVSFTNIILLHF